MPEVLTLEEVAAYLRLSPEAIEREALEGELPGRQIAETWRFLRSAIDDWLRSQNGRTLLMQHVGALRDDDTIEAWLTHMYEARQALPPLDASA